MFGDRNGHAVGIHLLKGIGADERPGNLTGYTDERDGIKVGIGDGGENGRQQAGQNFVGIPAAFGRTLVAPGPEVAKQTPGLPVDRAMP